MSKFIACLVSNFYFAFRSSCNLILLCFASLPHIKFGTKHAILTKHRDIKRNKIKPRWWSEWKKKLFIYLFSVGRDGEGVHKQRRLVISSLNFKVSTPENMQARVFGLSVLPPTSITALLTFPTSLNLSLSNKRPCQYFFLTLDNLLTFSCSSIFLWLIGFCFQFCVGARS